MLGHNSEALPLFGEQPTVALKYQARVPANVVDKIIPNERGRRSHLKCDSLPVPPS